jgi:hypothetical protein
MTDREVRLGGTSSAPPTVLTIVGGVALAVAFFLASLEWDNLRTLFHAYLTNFCFLLSLSLGALFLVAVLHATRSGWGVVVRRIAEILAANFAVLAILFLPIVAPMLLGYVPGFNAYAGLYPWVDPDAVEHYPALAGKTAWLNPGFFALRAAGYFLIWWLLARFFLNRSTEQDRTGDPETTVQMERVGGPAILLLAVTVTLASFDWLMSLDPQWYSTIFGLYFYSGGVVGALAAVILISVGLQRSGRLAAVHVEHYHDLGKLLFAAVVFWAYMAFSQYLLIWYANIPEETQWYRLRLEGGWGIVALVLVFGHLLIPFFGLLSRHAKRNKAVLAFWAAWLLVVHWFDVYWLVMPALRSEEFPLGLVDVCMFVGLGCLYLAGVWRLAASRALVPLKDPRLEESLALENV